MCVPGTPVERHPDLGLWVKREDLCCPDGPHFSKTRGVWAHVAARNERRIGVLDTAHSQGGWAVARACRMLGRECVLFYPVRRSEEGSFLKPQQRAAEELGARLVALPAGRSAVLYHRARAATEGYMMPNALKLPESVEETAAELANNTPLPPVGVVLVSASSGTIAAGVMRGLGRVGWRGTLIVHLGYSRPIAAVSAYVLRATGPSVTGVDLEIVDEGYAYADEARPGHQPPFPSDRYYDMKAFRWWMRAGRARFGEALMWNIG